jgi:L,D-transpeptidase ErfK/SrfK
MAKIMKICPLVKRTLIILSFSLFASAVAANTFSLPPPSEAIIGNLEYASGAGETAPSLAHRYDLGQNAIVAANAGIPDNAILPGGTVTIPNRFMLPPLPRKGVIINLPEMRLYYYPSGRNTVMTFPIGIGKIGKTIPLAMTSITRKVVNPTWTPPQDIREFNRNQGIELPYRMGPGPDNPLGPYAIYLRIPTYLIHSTIFPESIGRRASFGCIRMNEDDIKEFFPIIEPGTPVTIVNMPTKVAWQDNTLYLEVHPPLEEHSNTPSVGVNGAVNSIQQALAPNQLVFVNWQLVAYLAEQPDGIPHKVGVRIY